MSLQQKYSILGLTVCLLLAMSASLYGQDKPSEEDYYRISTVPVPEGIHLEAGGVLALPTGKVMVCTRRGNVWLIQNPTMAGNRNPSFKSLRRACMNLWVLPTKTTAFTLPNEAN